ncbi:MAG: SpoIIE family protein phosphatase [Terracidiphilus sp.]|nr:SpoIIE family protein phosphatase [Terracidiphilus sp.]
MRLASTLRRLAALAALALSCAAVLPAQTFDLEKNREPLVSLDGPWRFHPGDSPADPAAPSSFLWSQPAFDDSAWPLLQSNRSWSTQGYADMSGYAWYRFTVQLPPGDQPTSLLLAPIVTSFQVFVDGRLAGSSGPMPPTIVPNTRISHQVFPLTQAGSASHRTVQVAIRVWHSPIWAGYMGGGPYADGNLAGSQSLVNLEKTHRQLARDVRFIDYYAYSIAAGLVGLAIFCLFLIRHAEREYLWFALMLLAQAADSALNVSKEIYAFPPVPVFDLFDGMLAALNIFAAFCFFSKVLNARAGLLGRIFLVLVVLSPFPNVSYWPGWTSPGVGAAIQLLLLLPASFWIFALLGKRALAGNLDARLLLVPTLLDVGFYVADNVAIVLAQVGWSRFPQVLETPLSMPPFTMRPGILLHLVFLLAMCVFLILRFTRARRREAWLAGEFEAARQIQQVLLPDQQDQCPGFHVECIYQPAEQVGGDFFQQIGDGQCGMLIVVGDVSGKGLPAAMLVSVLVGAIRAQATHSTDPAGLLRCLNDRLMGRAHGGFTTCLAAHITVGGLLTLANAGHLPPYRNGEEIDLPGALPLGILPEVDFACSQVQLAPGDRLAFVSDGVVEAQSSSSSKANALFGFDRTRALSREPASVIAEAARLFGQNDDITVVTVQFLGAGLPATAN